MGRKMRLELTTSGTTNQRSNQLSYIRHRLRRLIFTRFLEKSQVKNSFLMVHKDFSLILKKNRSLQKFLKISYQKIRDNLGTGIICETTKIHERIKYGTQDIPEKNSLDFLHEIC